MLKAIIVDDEYSTRRLLEKLITDHCSDVAVVASADSVPKAVQSIHTYKPDMVFLDINMPIYNGFQVFDFIEEIDFDIIFVTASDAFMKEAFEVGAVHYLVKPIDIDQLLHAIDRVRRIRNPESILARVQIEGKPIASKTKKTIIIEQNGLTKILNLSDIVYVEGEGSYSKFNFIKDLPMMPSKSLKFYEDNGLSQDNGFYRIHKSYLVNINYVSEIQNNKLAVLQNGMELPIARERTNGFREFLNEYLR